MIYINLSVLLLNYKIVNRMVICMENKDTRTRKYWSTSTDHELYDKLKLFSSRSRIPVARLLDEAIEDLLLKHKEISEKTKTP